LPFQALDTPDDRLAPRFRERDLTYAELRDAATHVAEDPGHDPLAERRSVCRRRATAPDAYELTEGR
jgi:hypothetical protein